MVRKSGCIFLFLLVLLKLINPEETLQKVIIPRKMGIFLSITGDITEAEKILLQESLLIQLVESKDLIILEPVSFTTVPEEQMNTLVKQAGGDCWLQLTIHGNTESLTIKAISYDLFENKYKIKDQILEKDRKIRGITRGFWRDIYTDIEAGYKAIEELKEIKEIVTKKQIEEIVTINKGINLNIEGLPGTIITGLDAKPLVIGAEGKIQIDVAGFSTYDMRAAHTGYYPVNMNIYLADAEKSIKLIQKPGAILGGDLYLQNIDYLGLGIFYYLVPNSLFLELSATFYQQKLIWPVSEHASLYNLPLTHLFLTAGYYLLPEDSFIRLYLSTGVFIRIIGLPTGITIDPLSAWGLKLLSINGEIFTHNNIKPFFEYSWLFYFTKNGMMMKASLTDVDASNRLLAGYLFMDKMVIDLLHIQAGIRIQFP